MKYVLVIGDGMADTYLPQLAGKTPLEALALNAFDRAAGCWCGRALTVPHGLPAGSDTAILSIFGYDPRKYYTGRSVLEAAGMGVKVPKGCVSFRVNLCAVTPDDSGALVIHSHNGGNIHGEEAVTLMNDLLADPAFAALMKDAGLAHMGVGRAAGKTFSTAIAVSHRAARAADGCPSPTTCWSSPSSLTCPTCCGKRTTPPPGRWARISRL